MVCRSGLPETASRIIGGCLFAAKQTHTGPGISRHLGLRAEATTFALSQTSSRKENHHVILFVAAKSEPLGARGAPSLIGILDRGVAQGPIEGA